MDQIFKNALDEMQRSFDELELQIRPPALTLIHKNYVFRYAEKSIEQALIQKLARTLSGLRAAWVLLTNGYVQEQGVIQRTLDEFHEDIQFLAVARTNDSLTPLHQEYLDAFYMEEFDATTASPTTFPKRPMIKREKIRSYTVRILSPFKDTFTVGAIGTKISKAYSGFVHGASPHIMDMYGGSPPHFHTSGMLGTPRIREHHQDIRNYFYRALLSFSAVGKVFGNSNVVEKIARQLVVFEKTYGERLLKPPKS